MGSFATLYLFKRIIEYAPSNNDRDYLEVFVHNNSRIPDRTAALLDGGANPLPELLRSALALEKSGSDYIVMACVTAHFYSNEISKYLKDAVLISILDATTAYLHNNYPPGLKVGILASTGAIRTGLWQQHLQQIGLESLVLPEDLQQTLIMDAICGEAGLKKGIVSGVSRDKFLSAIRFLEDMGADLILAGCSEVPMVISADDTDLQIIDSIEILINNIYSSINPRINVCPTN